MSALGAFTLVLHAHLPWVLHHGRWPHGQAWLYEATSASWLPLLDTLDSLTKPAWTVGITPVLAEQWAHPSFEAGFRAWVDARIARAKADYREFRRTKDPRAPLAARWIDIYKKQRRPGNLLARFRKHVRNGTIELLSGPATHGYLPLLADDRSIQGQIRMGLATSRRHRVASRGIWLPECAYRPDRPDRRGVGTLLAQAGIRHFVVEASTLAKAQPYAVFNGKSFRKLRQLPNGLPALSGTRWEDSRGWCLTGEPHRLVENNKVLPITVLARCHEVAERVWNAQIGYPGDPRYLEFHKRHGDDGLRYWRVTGPVDLGAKQLYDPDAAADAIRDQADHFVKVIRGRLLEHRAATGRYGVVCTPFDAELFGHWWHEGPAFLQAISERIAAHPEIDARGMRAIIAQIPADKAVVLPEGSWGNGGDHSTWTNDRVSHWWTAEHAAERRFLASLDAPRTPEIDGWLTQAARELLLLQASDWAFVVTTKGATDYGLRRIGEHQARLDELLNGIDDLRAGQRVDPTCSATRALAEAVDDLFGTLDLDGWSPCAN